MYNKIVLDHFHNPKNLQEMKNADAAGMGASQICGDIMTLFIKVDGNKIKNASFTTMGCSVAIASGSILTEMLKGKSLEEASTLKPSSLTDALGGLPAIKMHCPELAIEALRAALKKINESSSSNALVEDPASLKTLDSRQKSAEGRIRPTGEHSGMTK